MEKSFKDLIELFRKSNYTSFIRFLDDYYKENENE